MKKGILLRIKRGLVTAMIATLVINGIYPTMAKAGSDYVSTDELNNPFQFAIYANNYTQENHVEGNVAIGTLFAKVEVWRGRSFFGDLSQPAASFKCTHEINTVVMADVNADGTYNRVAEASGQGFTIYVQNDAGENIKSFITEPQTKSVNVGLNIKADIAANMEDMRALSSSLYELGNRSDEHYFIINAYTDELNDTVINNIHAAAENDKTVVVNVLNTGDVTLMNNMFKEAYYPHATNIIWNFGNATTVELNTVNGTVLAPNATVSNGSVIVGSVITDTLHQGGEVHQVNYTKPIPTPTPAPTPAPVDPTEPTPAPVDPTEPTPAPVDPTEPTPAPVDPTEPTPAPVDPTEPTPAPVDPTEPTPAPVDPTEPTPAPVDPTEPTPAPVDPTEPTPAPVDPTEPTPAPVDPTEPTPAPVDPTEPTPAPVDPTEPTPAPVDPTEPTPAPVDPTEPTPAPVDPTEPTPAPVDPTEPTPAPVDPTEPTPAPVDPTEPTPAPVDPTEPTPAPVDPTEPTPAPTPAPADPAPTTAPADPAPTTAPVDPADPADPAPTTEPADPVPTTAPVDPADPAPTTAPADPEPTTAPVDPADPAPTTAPADPEPTTAPVDPADPVPTTAPVDPADPAPTADPGNNSGTTSPDNSNPSNDGNNGNSGNTTPSTPGATSPDSVTPATEPPMIAGARRPYIVNVDDEKTALSGAALLGSDKRPQTGDASDIWTVAFLASLSGLIAWLLQGRRK